MDTKSYNYNEALKELNVPTIFTDDVFRMITDTSNTFEHGTRDYNEKETSIEQTVGNKHGLYYPEAEQAYKAIKEKGQYPYLTTVAIELLNILGIDRHDMLNDRILKRAKHVCFYTNRYISANEVIK